VLDRKTGTQVWAYELGRAIVGTPAVVEGMIVVACMDGSVYAFGEGSR
jgi:outer membrane protein assembly factor BamB